MGSTRGSPNGARGIHVAIRPQAAATCRQKAQFAQRMRPAATSPLRSSCCARAGWPATGSPFTARISSPATMPWRSATLPGVTRAMRTRPGDAPLPGSSGASVSAGGCSASVMPNATPISGPESVCTSCSQARVPQESVPVTPSRAWSRYTRSEWACRAYKSVFSLRQCQACNDTPTTLCLRMHPSYGIHEPVGRPSVRPLRIAECRSIQTGNRRRGQPAPPPPLLRRTTRTVGPDESAVDLHSRAHFKLSELVGEAVGAQHVPSTIEIAGSKHEQG